METKEKERKYIERYPWFKVYDDRPKDQAFADLTWAQRGMYHWLECIASSQKDRWIVANSSSNLCKVVCKLLQIRKNQFEKLLQKLHECDLVNYDLEEGWIWLRHTEEKQIPLTDAERARRYRQKKTSRKRHFDVTGERHAIEQNITKQSISEHKEKPTPSVLAASPAGKAPLLYNEKTVFEYVVQTKKALDQKTDDLVMVLGEKIRQMNSHDFQEWKKRIGQNGWDVELKERWERYDQSNIVYRK